MVGKGLSILCICKNVNLGNIILCIISYCEICICYLKTYYIRHNDSDIVSNIEILSVYILEKWIQSRNRTV